MTRTVLMNGCLPELVEHGRTGWLAKSPDDLAALVRAAAPIDPRECREQAARRFTPAVMAAGYADLCEKLISGFVPRAAEKAVPDRAGYCAGGQWFVPEGLAEAGQRWHEARPVRRK